jgi:NADPH:quinone reductase-like Zn-dependent oxidoreductase
MKAAVYTKYGPPEVVTVAEVPKPVPKAGEILVRIRATTVSTADWRARSLEMPPGFGMLGRLVFGLTGPRKTILGTELSGVVETVGPSVTRFKVGDEVAGFPGSALGSHAEYRATPEKKLVRKPANLSFEEAGALFFGGTTALHFLRKAGIKPGDTILIVGASGSIGTAAIQIARHFGADVTAVCSAANADLVRSLGASRVIDYATTDFATTGDTWDIILDTTGTAPIARVERALKPGGRLLVALGSFTAALGLERPSRGGGKKVVAGVAPEKLEDMETLAQLAEAGAYRPVIDRVYPLNEIVAAHARVDTGRKRGNVVVALP